VSELLKLRLKMLIEQREEVEALERLQTEREALDEKLTRLRRKVLQC
jgi:predicted DNA-binding protein (UPF0251 family)